MGKHEKPNDDGMQEAKFCSECGERNSATAKFCHDCGFELPKKRGGTARIIPTGKHRKKKK
jgi:ribosomal protein L40E